MSLSRRGFLAGVAGSAALAGGQSVGLAAADSVDVTGRVESAAGADVSGATVEVVEPENRDDRFETTLGSDGRFAGSVDTDGSYEVLFFDGTSSRLIPDPNDRPFMYFFGLERIPSDGDLGTLTLPRGYESQIRFVTAEGNPIEGLPVSFRAPNGTGPGTGQFTTTPDGYVRHAAATDPGVELAGQVDLEVYPPGGEPTFLERIGVTAEGEFSVTVPNPRQYEVTIRDADSGDAIAEPSSGSTEEGSRRGSDGRQRGFFTNSGDEPPVLSNALNLTTLGFLLSVGGIAHQLVKGR